MINHIPDFEEDQTIDTIDPEDVWENDIRIPVWKQLYLESKGVNPLYPGTICPDSSSSYNPGEMLEQTAIGNCFLDMPIAEIVIFEPVLEFAEPLAINLVLDDFLEIVVEMPGGNSNPMANDNYLSLPGWEQVEATQESSSAS